MKISRFASDRLLTHAILAPVTENAAGLLLQEMGMGGQLWDRESAMQEVARGEFGDDYGETAQNYLGLSMLKYQMHDERH